jgi:soluble lytic murein transglycosylase
MVVAIENNAPAAIRRIGRPLGLDPGSVDDAIERPVRALTGRAGREITIIALARLSRQDLREARQRADSVGLAAADRALVAAQISASAMRRLDPDALSLAREGCRPPTSATRPCPGWRVRRFAARTGRRSARSSRRMSGEAQKDPTWVYWKARSHLAQGRRDEGEPLLRSIAGQYHFYGQLAGENSVSSPSRRRGPRPRRRPNSPRPSATRDCARALQFYRLGLRAEGNRGMELPAARAQRSAAAGGRRFRLPPQGAGPLRQHRRPHRGRA